MRATFFLPAVVFVVASRLWAQTGPAQQDEVELNQSEVASDLTDALPPDEWDRIDDAVDKALTWLAAEQRPDGSFPTRDQGQPAITSLCVMAFLSAGHQPGQGKYGDVIDKAIDYVLETQQESGLFSRLPLEGGVVHQGASHAAPYNHAIAGLMLTEVYGQVSPARAAKIRPAVVLALKETARQQVEPAKTDPIDVGGWRYPYAIGGWSVSDLSVTGWQLKFLRSAKNAQFEIHDEEITSATKYVESTFRAEEGEFYYGRLGPNDQYSSRGLMGVGALSLALAGKHDTEMARQAGDWIIAHPFDVYHATNHKYDRFHYAAYYCSNAMAQLGGANWEKFFPVLAKTLLEAQDANGSWLSESGEDSMYGPVYPTALSVLSLTPAYQLLPIYQR